MVRNYPYTTPPSGYRLPEEIELGKVRLQIADLPRSIAHYEKVLGLQVLERTSTSVSLSARGSARVLVELNEKPGVNAVPRRGRLGLYHFAILLPDRPSLGRFLQHLSDIGESAGMSDHLVSEAIYLTDPDGLGIEVYADKPRTSWAVNGSNLSMGSLHLDTDALIRAGAGIPWDGIPPETVIGHVHLYVDSLETAEKFYHNAVGFDKVNLEFPGALFMSAGGYHHNLGTNTWAAHSPPSGENDARLLEWNVRLNSRDDIDRLSESLRRSGYAADSHANVVLATDPWGTTVRFSAES